MEFTVPCDFKTETIDKFEVISKKYKGNKVAEVYGNLKNFISIGNGRGYLDDTNIDDIQELKQYVAYIKGKGVNFNYTINAACTENKELKYTGQKEIISRIDYLLDIGIKKFTVASMSLVSFLNHIYKNDIEITLSTIANVDSVHRAKNAERLGVKTIVLGEDETRNFPLIRNIRKSVDCNLEIVVNSMCIWNCIYRQSHYNSLSHCISDNQKESIYFPGQCYFFNRCNPVEEIKTPWIRPEDMVKYDEAGINIFKFIGREIANVADWEKMFEIYCKGDFDGNLLELLRGFSSQPEVYIDNKALDGYVNYFMEQPFRCKYICETGKCNYCDVYYKKAHRV